MDTKYGVMGYASHNIGDEIQTLAQMRFIPRVDYLCVRESLSKFKSLKNEKVKLIMNAWYMWRPQYFPPSEDIIPLPISMHFAERKCPQSFFEVPDVKAWLKDHGPIGTRDMYTCHRLHAAGIEAYFSGCMTLTLLPNKSIKKKYKNTKYVLAVDLNKSELDTLKSRTDIPVYSINKMFYGSSNANRLELARCVLSLYHNAHVVVSRNLHTAMPTLAMQTPTLLISSDKDASFIARTSGMLHFVHNITSKEFINNSKLYDIDNPPKNPDYYKEVAKNLTSACTEFTGFDSKESPLLDDFNPTFALVNLLQHDSEQIERTLYYANEEQLLQALYDVRLKKQNKYSIATRDSL